MKTNIQGRLEGHQVCEGTSLPRIPEFDRGELVSLDGAAMLLAWFGLASCNLSLFPLATSKKWFRARTQPLSPRTKRTLTGD
jgi:hypothetical protein